MKIERSLVKWERFVNNILVTTQKNFIIHERNGTKTAVWNAEKKFGIMYRKKLTEEELKKIWVFGAVKQNLKRYIKNNPKFEIFDSVNAVGKNSDMINNLTQGEIFRATDASHCYWRMAHNLNYLSSHMYEKLATPDYKLIRNKALACCASMEKQHIFQAGEYVRTIIDPNSDPRLPVLYANIRFKSYELMKACMIACGKESFLKYKIDCIYYMPDRQEQVEAIFKANNMLYKTTECVYIGEGYFIELDKVKKL